MRKRAWFPVLFLAVFSLSLTAAFKKEDVKVHKLDNGLKVLLVEDHNIPSVALYTFFRVGSRNERPGLTGVSHFIEHMMFNGTPQVGPGEFDRRMEFRGGSNNAFTSEDMTGYTDWFPPAALEAMIEMEADRIQGLALVPEVFESERGVIASERRLGVENDNDAILNENVRATAIMAHPYHWDVIGWMSDILSWRRDEVMVYYRTYYAPGNAILIVVGDIDPAKTLGLIQKYYGPVKASPAPPPVSTVEPPQMGMKTVIVRKEAQAPSFLAVWHAPSAKDADYLPLAILAKPLLEGESSRLYRRLVREEELAIDVGGGIQETIDPLLFSIDVKPRPGVDLDKIDRIIEEELAKVKAEGITPQEYAKAMNIIRNDFYMSLQTISGKAGQLGSTELLYGDFARLFTVMDDYAAVKIDRIKVAAGKYFTDNNKTIGKLIPEGGAK
ncbi:MAG: insulinase family protein [Acidobacteria bacterium]|nr:insulinase family protein [Acidobacteriota bacterium]MBE3124123.1 insulinase family protein [Acidobacteriota bacterium]